MWVVRSKPSPDHAAVVLRIDIVDPVHIRSVVHDGLDYYID